MGAAGLGARVALVERHRLGGDCLNSGCVPSKALLRAAKAIGELRLSASLGIDVSDVQVNYSRVVARVHARRAHIAEHDSVARLRGAGVDVFFGDGSFADTTTITVDGALLRFRRAVIATGGRPAFPPIPGLDRVPFHTNETIFELTELPRRLLVIGAGPVGCELAQALARFGAKVTVVDQARHLLGREDPEAAGIIRKALERDGVQFELGVRIEAAESDGDEVRLRLSSDPDAQVNRTIVGDALLVAAGRAPNIEGLALEAAGVQANSQGVVVNDRLQTSNHRVYAPGDVCSAYKFTHAADAMSRLVVQNALFFGRRKASALLIPWVTYTAPELAHVGATHADVTASGGHLGTVTVPLTDIDRAIVDDETDGFVRVHHERGKLRGCTIVATHAGEMIGEAAYALNHHGTLARLSNTIHPYPTQSEAFRKAGDVYRRQALTARVRRWFTRYFEWTR